ncbi:unnamed protein product [Dicrocoelium dendriticum]|nr:unnamed protein product [Dicrocoelium dendriticum]
MKPHWAMMRKLCACVGIRATRCTRNAREKRIRALNIELACLEKLQSSQTCGTGFHCDRLHKRTIAELEREVAGLTNKLEATTLRDDQRENMWSYIEAQRDCLVARTELFAVRAALTEAEKQREEMRLQKQSVQRELSLVNTELVATQRAHAEEVSKLEDEVERLTREVSTLRKQCTKVTLEEIREIEATESEDLYKSLRELRNEVGWLKYLTTTLGQTCNALKRELSEMDKTEAELVSAQSELEKLQDKLSQYQQEEANREKHTIKAQEDYDYRNGSEDGQKLLHLKAENRRLQRTLELLCTQLPHMDQGHYHFITGV